MIIQIKTMESCTNFIFQNYPPSLSSLASASNLLRSQISRVSRFSQNSQIQTLAGMKSNSEYGAIPTTSAAATPSTSDISFFSGVRHTAHSAVAHRRPWSHFFSLSSFSLPISYREAMSRIKHNVAHFRINYVMLTLFILFLSLLYHPLSMIVFLVVFIGWLFLYFFRDEPVRVWNWVVDERVVVVGLSVVTVVALALTRAGLNVLVSLVIAVVVIGLHAGFRSVEDAYLDEESAVEGGLVSVVGSSVPLKSSTGYSSF